MSELKYSIFLNKTSKDFSNRGFEAILAIVLALGFLLLLLLFPVAGIALMFFAYGFICVGTKSYLLGIARGELLPVESIFSKFKICVKAFCLKVATTLLQFLWTLVFIIPGIICALNYSFASFVMADEDLPALECMAKSKKLVNGHRGEILIVYLSYFFVTMVIICLAMAIATAFNFYFALPSWTGFVIMSIIALFFIIIFVVPYFELMFANIYLILKNNKTPAKKTTKTTTVKQKNKTTQSISN